MVYSVKQTIVFIKEASAFPHKAIGYVINIIYVNVTIRFIIEKRNKILPNTHRKSCIVQT